VTARYFITCPVDPWLLRCPDDAAYPGVETEAAALALHAIRYPDAVGKEAFVVVDCEIGGCGQRTTVRAASIDEGRVLISRHGRGWYLARRAAGLVDGCQWHLGCCCVEHARRVGLGCRHTLDPEVVLPGEPGFPGGGSGQLDLFG